jgi:PAS domain S-box-containing protein
VEINAVRIDWMGRPATLNFLPDVTERKRTEEKIEQLSRFPEENPDPVLRVAADGELMYANAGSRLLLLTLQCEVGQRMTESWQERVRDTLTSNSPNSVAEVTCGDKTYSLTLAPVASAGYVNVYGRDITERQQAEVALRKSEARLQEAQALGRTGNWEFDLDSQKIEWSDETYRLYERDKPLGPPTLEEEASYYSHDEVLRLRGFARQATEEGRDLSYDLTANLPSGRTVFFSASMRPVKDETGRVVKLFGTMHDITDRKQAEAALRESEEKYRLVIDTAGEAILVAQDAKMVFTNPRTSEMTGYTREELLGRSFIEFIHPDDRTLVADRYRRRIAGEHVPDRYDFRIVGRGGETHQVEINAVRIDWMGRPATLNFLADVTERKQAEEEIAQAKLRLEYLFKSSPVVIYTAAGSADSGATFISGNVVALIGFEPSDFLDDPGFWLDHIHPEDRDRVVAELPQMFKQPSYVHEYRFRKKDGDYIWVRDEVRVLRDARGEPVEVIGSWSDVTERRRAEEALRTSEAQLSNAMEIARLGYWEYDVADDLFTFNDHFYDVFRTTAEKVGGYKMSSAQYAGRFVHPDDVAVVGAETRKAIETTDPHFSRQLEHRIIYADGSVGHISVRFFIIKDSQGRTVKTYGANQDITERKLAEAEIAQKNAQLVELNDVKNQLLGMAAHDLRNPLSVVSTASAFLLDDAGRLLPEAKRTDFLRRINSSSEFMLRMIDDLLDVAKIEAGRLDLELATGDLCGLIEENLTMNRMLAERKGIRLDFAPECNVPPFRFDRGKVEQVLNNLISNALKFSASGTAVTVQVSRVNGSVVVSVRDQGSGIPTKELDKLFKPFGTTSVRGTAGEKSTGLGLAICRKIAEGHHGRIWAESEVGKGSVFSFSLPVPAPA